MTTLSKRFFTLYTILCLISAVPGCAIVGMVVPTAVSGCAVGINYTFTNIAYKTICYPVADVADALQTVFEKMDIKETKIKAEEGKVSVMGATGKLDIYIYLEKITPTVTSIKVNAEKGIFLKDKAMATEIIVQTEKTLEEKT